jgi:hypothetical protein
MRAIAAIVAEFRESLELPDGTSDEEFYARLILAIEEQRRALRRTVGPSRVS